MNDLDRWLDQAWSDHADRPGEVAARMAAEGASFAASDADGHALARLSHHVHGDHLGGEPGRLEANRVRVRALAQARATSERLDPGDAPWCRASLDRLASGGRR